MPPDTGKTFQGLKLLASCGAGAYGEVWYCEDLSGRRLALKTVSKKRLGGVWERELHGVRNYCRITEKSPGLLRIFHVAETADEFYYTMEAADNAGSGTRYLPDTLARRLQYGALPPEQLYPTLRGIFDGIRAIHEAGFAHRDIKPDNILFVGGAPKLGDIGLVSSLSNSMTKLAGTLEFLPPEARTSPGSADRASRQRSDLYAFGKVVYCAATGLDASDYPSLPTRAVLSPEFKYFIQLSFRLCAGRQGLRIDSIDALAKDLDRIERELECGGKRPPLGWRVRHLADRLSEWTRRHALLILLLIAILAAAGATLPLLIRKYRPQKPEAANVPARKTENPDGTQEYVVTALDLKMRIPKNWQAMSDGHIRALVGEMTKELEESTKSEKEKEKLRNAIAKAKNWKGLIRCDLYDVIELSRITLPSTAEKLWTTPGEKIRSEIMTQLGTFDTDSAKIYEIKRITLAKRRCIVMDFAVDRHNRIRQYLFLEPPNHAVVVALTGDSATFKRRAKEFEAVMKTLEFTTPPPKYETPAAGNTRTLADPLRRFTIDIPRDWQVMPESHIKNELRRLTGKNRSQLSTGELHRIEVLKLMDQKRGMVIRCSAGGKDFFDTVELYPDSEIPKSELWPKTDDEIMTAMRNTAAQYRGIDFAIYSSKHTKVAGYDAILLEVSNDPAYRRQLACIIYLDDDLSFNISLTAHHDTFAARRAQYEAALKTLKFQK